MNILDVINELKKLPDDYEVVFYHADTKRLHSVNSIKVHCEYSVDCKLINAQVVLVD